MKTYSTKEVNSVFFKIKKLKIFVIGDAMLDCYWHGQINRISPEAPVPVVHVTTKTRKLGGAANVALNCKALGADVHLYTVLGQDDAGKEMISLLNNEGIDTAGCILSKARITTTKTRLMTKHQQVMRVDEEILTPLNTKEEHHLIDVCMRAIQIEEPDIVIFEDYNKGILLPNVIQKLTEHAKRLKALVAVDPKKEHFFSYEGVDIFKPNLKEVKEAFNLSSIQPSLANLHDIHKTLVGKLHHQITLITLSEHGIFAEQDKTKLLLPAHVRNVADVSGAGDTVIAVFTAFFRASNDLLFATHAANLAGGIVCEEVGVNPINKLKLLNELVS